MVRLTSRVLGAAALVALATGTLGLVTPLIALGVAVVAPSTARQAALRLKRAPYRLLARQAFIEAEAAKAIQKRFRRGSSQPKVPRKVPSTQPAMEPFATRPTALYNVLPGEYSRSCRELAWTGKALTVTDRRGATLAWSTVTGGVLRGTRLHRQATAPDLGDLLVAEIVATKVRAMPLDRIHLLDRWSRRLATVPVLGVVEDGLAALAAHAGVAFTIYELPPRVRATPETLIGALFPRSVFYRRLSGVLPEWRWLEPVGLVTRLVKAMLEESVYDAQGELTNRAVKH